LAGAAAFAAAAALPLAVAESTARWSLSLGGPEVALREDGDLLGSAFAFSLVVYDLPFQEKTFLPADRAARNALLNSDIGSTQVVVELDEADAACRLRCFGFLEFPDEHHGLPFGQRTFLRSRYFLIEADAKVRR
jgi:hypothetical protein